MTLIELYDQVRNLCHELDELRQAPDEVPVRVEVFAQSNGEFDVKELRKVYDSSNGQLSAVVLSTH